MDYAKNIREGQCLQITSLKENGQTFCASFDEWTSGRNRRFLNIIIHGLRSTFWNFGLKRINGSLSAERCLELLANSLAEFN